MTDKLSLSSTSAGREPEADGDTLANVANRSGAGSTSNFLRGDGTWAAPAGAGGAQHTGTFIANGATPVSVADTHVTANSVIVFTLKTVGGTVGAYPAIQTITPSTGFTVAATAGDTSTYNYMIIG